MAALDSQLAETSDAGRLGARRAVGLWLLACAAMVFVMAVVGAITRLTESGLSIMEWAPLMGTLPPFTEAEWLRLFMLYQETGEYRASGGAMDLPEFKTIFWWEYIHRLWGRLIGLVFGGGFLWFLLTGRLERRLVGPLALLFALGGLQGFLGWYMVASGFSARTDVSQYRLVIHLSLAVAIYAALLWTVFGLLDPRSPARTDARAGDATRRPEPAWPRNGALALCLLIATTLVSGGFVAGLDAGFIYNSFPLMGGELVPADYAAGEQESWIVNAFENPTAAQLHHRALAVLTLAAALALWLASCVARLPDALGRALALPMALVGLLALLQFGLGVVTLLLVVPVWLGSLHQGCALLLLGAALWALHRGRRTAP